MLSRTSTRLQRMPPRSFGISARAPRPPFNSSRGLVLDALVNEAQLRWGLDLSQGLQVVPAEWLVAVPIEPSRPMIVIPRLALRPGLVGASTGETAEGPAGPGSGPAVSAAGVPDPEP